MSDDSQKIKICRNCHTIYKSFTQKYCGNGCELKPPYFKEGKMNTSIIPREVLMPKISPLTIRWVCLNCGREYSQEKLEQKEFLCDCGSKNDFYPFTYKECGNSECMLEGKLHILPLEAKACDLCGKTDFIFNGILKKNELKPSVDASLSSICWDESFRFESCIPEKMPEPDKSLLSCKFSIKNNNTEYLLYGQNLSISVRDLIKHAKAYLPDIIYQNLIKDYSLSNPIFNIKYNPESKSFSFSTFFETSVSELDARLTSQKEQNFPPKEKISLKENILTQIQAGFFKIQIWVY